MNEQHKGKNITQEITQESASNINMNLNFPRELRSKKNKAGAKSLKIN